MKSTGNTTELKEIPIPEYISITKRLKCSHCKYYSYSWSECRKKSVINSRFSCYRFYNRFAVSKFVSSLIFLILGIVYNFIYFSSFWTSVLIMAVLTTSLILVDIISDVIFKHLSLHLEKRRKQKYDCKVEKIEEQNKIIRKQMLGISDEYEAFIANSKALYSSLKNSAKVISTIFESPSQVDERIIQKFEKMLEEFANLNEKLSLYNYEDSTIIPIYNVYLPRLKENSNYFIELANKGKLTGNQKVEFSNLLEVFRKKFESENVYLDYKLEQDFINKIQALNRDLSPEYDGGEKS